MRAELGLPSVKGDDEHGGGMTGGFGGSMGGAGQGGKGKRPISVKFEIPYFTTSGIQVRYLKIIEPKVSAVTIRALLILPLLAHSSILLRCHWLARLFLHGCMHLAVGPLQLDRNLQAFLILSDLLARQICHKIHGTIRHEARSDAVTRISAGSCLDLSSYAL